MKLLLAWCAPWLVALPLSAVRRIAAQESTPVGGSGATWLGRVAGLTAEASLPAWDVGGLLGLSGAMETSSSWIIIEQPLLAALRVGKCLQVVEVNDVTSVPTILGSPRGTQCFATVGLKTGLYPQPDFGLVLAPEHLLSVAATAVNHHGYAP